MTLVFPAVTVLAKTTAWNVILLLFVLYSSGFLTCLNEACRASWNNECAKWLILMLMSLFYCLECLAGVGFRNSSHIFRQCDVWRIDTFVFCSAPHHRIKFSFRRKWSGTETLSTLLILCVDQYPLRTWDLNWLSGIDMLSLLSVLPF